MAKNVSNSNNDKRNGQNNNSNSSYYPLTFGRTDGGKFLLSAYADLTTFNGSTYWSLISLPIHTQDYIFMIDNPFRDMFRWMLSAGYWTATILFVTRLESPLEAIGYFSLGKNLGNIEKGEGEIFSL